MLPVNRECENASVVASEKKAVLLPVFSKYIFTEHFELLIFFFSTCHLAYGACHVPESIISCKI